MRFGISSAHNILHLIPEWIWLLATLTGTEISSPNLQLQICSGCNMCPALICNHAWFNPGANLYRPPHTIPSLPCPWNVSFVPSSPESLLDGIGSHLNRFSPSHEEGASTGVGDMSPVHEVEVIKRLDILLTFDVRYKIHPFLLYSPELGSLLDQTANSHRNRMNLKIAFSNRQTAGQNHSDNTLL